ncbi:tyrosine-protein kinase STYK1 [Puntigrus tetrazona]|uniref:tyrosine-protein kinase STYK1 n=1 Tax=Puntigrus tetrazona TaxID=1606681 RepID=UPI001C8A682D|nr:tyrosine-protein kinase STYK1 [Puntigrus tetrazona]XP_043073151.1 tyrosine-protein kinase STYK1 [Puntigrus tetrazona]XP_043073152.1 tyrosine-protein kinase STYK1 [Puntigrus tetrazona]
MSNSTNTTNLCASGTLCEVLFYEVELIVIPVLFLLAFLVTLIILLVLKCSHKPSYLYGHHRNEKDDKLHHHNTRRHPNSNRRHLQGIDAPAELNPLEHEVIPMTAQPHHDMQNSSPAVPEQTTGRHPDLFQLISPLPLTFSVKKDTFTLHRAVMDRQPVILRVLKESANTRERQSFLGFAHFLSELGPHPSLPKLLGVVSVQTPLMIAVEELEHRDLLSFLWRCRQDHTGQEAPCDMTERRIFTMGAQIASALEYLHGKNCIHGNVKAQSVLVGQDLTVKLWGLGPAYRRKTTAASIDVKDMEMRKWQAPEALARQPLQQSSDLWSFGILLHEMVTLGEPPFPNIMASELLQHLQRINTLKRPPNCSNTLYSIIKSCCQWKPKDRVSLAELIRKLQSGERSANDQAVLRVSEPLDMEKYMREAGYGETFNYAVL